MMKILQASKITAVSTAKAIIQWQIARSLEITGKSPKTVRPICKSSLKSGNKFETLLRFFCQISLKFNKLLATGAITLSNNPDLKT